MIILFLYYTSGFLREVNKSRESFGRNSDSKLAKKAWREQYRVSFIFIKSVANIFRGKYGSNFLLSLDFERHSTSIICQQAILLHI